MIGHDRAAALVILAAAAAYFLGAWRLERPAMADPLGPSAFPLLLGGSLLLLAVLLFLFPPRPSGEPTAQPAGAGTARLGRPGLVLGLLVANALTMEWLGYGLSTSAFFLGALTVLGERPWPRGILYSLAFTAGLYLVFARALHLRLPVGTLFGGH